MKHALGGLSIALLASIAAVAVSACEPTQPRTGTLDGSEDNYTGGVKAGRRDAENDLRAGILRLKAYGLPADWRPTYERMLKERYGVEYDVVAGCMVTSDLTDYVTGYNGPMHKEITRRFGKDVLKKLAAEAQVEHARE